MKYQHGKNRQFPQILTIFAGCLAGINSGIMYAWTSPSIPILISKTDITLEQTSYFTVLPSLTMLIVSALFPFFTNKLGRKWSIILSAVPHTLTWIITGIADNVWLFYAARIVNGIADSATYAVIPIYFGEIAEPSIRGTWGTMLPVSIIFGMLVINVIGSYASIKSTAWICICIPILFGALSSLMPESPYYLLAKGKDDRAREALRKLRWREDVDVELLAIKKYIITQASEAGTLKDLFQIKSNRRALFICIGLRLAQAYSGLFAFQSYTQYTFQQAGGHISEKTASIIFTGAGLACLILSVSLVEKLGRRPLAIFSTIGCALFLTIESIYFCLKQFTELDLSSFNWIPLAGMMGFILASNAGQTFLATLMAGELLSTSIKEKATTILVANHALQALIVPKVFQVLTYNFGAYSAFLFFSLCTYGAVAFTFFFVIETKGKTLEEVQLHLKGNEGANNI